MADDAKADVCCEGRELTYEELTNRCASLEEAISRLRDKDIAESQRSIHLTNTNEHLMRQVAMLSETNQMLAGIIGRLTMAGRWGSCNEASNG